MSELITQRWVSPIVKRLIDLEEQSEIRESALRLRFIDQRMFYFQCPMHYNQDQDAMQNDQQMIDSHKQQKSAAAYERKTSAPGEKRKAPSPMQPEERLARDFGIARGQKTQSKYGGYDNESARKSAVTVPTVKDLIKDWRSQHFVPVDQPAVGLIAVGGDGRSPMTSSGPVSSSELDSSGSGGHASQAYQKRTALLQRRRSSKALNQNKSSFYIKALKNDFAQDKQRQGRNDEPITIGAHSQSNADVQGRRQNIFGEGNEADAQRDHEMVEEGANESRQSKEGTGHFAEEQKEAAMQQVINQSARISSHEKMSELTEAKLKVHNTFNDIMAAQQQLPKPLADTQGIKREEQQEDERRQKLAKMLAWQSMPDMLIQPQQQRLEVPQKLFESRAERVLYCRRLQQSAMGLSSGLSIQSARVNQNLRMLEPVVAKQITSLEFLVKFKQVSFLHCQWMPGLQLIYESDLASDSFLLQSIIDLLSGKANGSLSDTSSPLQTPSNVLLNKLLDREKPSLVHDASRQFTKQARSPSAAARPMAGQRPQKNSVTELTKIEAQAVSSEERALAQQCAAPGGALCAIQAELGHKNYPVELVRHTMVEQVLSTPTMYPLIHSSSFKNIAGNWREDCIRILDVLLNIHKRNICFGLLFSAYEPRLYFNELIEQERDRIEAALGSPFQVVNLTQLQNLLFSNGLKSPYQFWHSLGKILKAYMLLEPEEGSLTNQYTAMMRTLSLCMFKRWKQECPEHYGVFLMENLENKLDKKLEDAFTSKLLSHTYQVATRIDEMLKSNTAKPGDSAQLNGAHERNQVATTRPTDLAHPTEGEANVMTDLADLHLFQQILNQNQKIITIQQRLTFGDQQKHLEIECLNNSLNLFIENQRLLQKLLLNLRNHHSQMKQFETDYEQVQIKRSAENDSDLLALRDKMLTQNSYALEQLTRSKLLSSSESSDTQPKQQPALGSDSSSLEKAPIFIFGLLNRSKDAPPLKHSQFKPSPVTQADASSPLDMVRQRLNQLKTTSKATESTPVPQALSSLLSEKPQAAAPQFDSQIGKLSDKIKEFLSKQSNQATGTSQQVPSLPQAPLRPQPQPLPSAVTNQHLAHAELQAQLNSQPSLALPHSPLTHDDKKGVDVVMIASRPTPQIHAQDGANEKLAESTELRWILFEKEKEQEILVNPFLFEDEVQSLLKSLFQKSSSEQEEEGNNTIDVSRYYLDRASDQRGAGSNSTENQRSRGGEQFSFEPLFLVKWAGLSYLECTWESLSNLSGPNYQKVLEFLSQKHRVRMQERILNSQITHNQKQLQKLEQHVRATLGVLSEADETQLFVQQKQIMDQFVTALCEEAASEKKPSEKSPFDMHPSYYLNKLQQSSLSSLKRAFVSEKNKVLADVQGLGKRTTVVAFLQSLLLKFHLRGPFLLICAENKLRSWNRLFKKFSELRPLIYFDPCGEEGMQSLRQLALYHYDVTVRGRMTTRNKLPKFDVLITTASQIRASEDSFIRKTPFLQVVVDQAHIEEHCKATEFLVCKRIICTTSRPFHRSFKGLAALIRCVDPLALSGSSETALNTFGPSAQRSPEGFETWMSSVSSMQQLKAVWRVASPLVQRAFATDTSVVRKQLNQFDVEVNMTAVQQLLYSEVYQQNSDLISKLERGEKADEKTLKQLHVVDDLLLRCCSSTLLVDQEESMLESLSLVGKRDVRSHIKQQMVSGKMLVVRQIIESFKKHAKKLIIATHYADLLPSLRKYFKETGVACFSFTQPMSIDSVYRFNLYSGVAVFLLHIGQTWSADQCSLFDFDMIQNVVIFDQSGSPQQDLVDIFKVARAFSINANVYRLIAQNSYEQRKYEYFKLNQELQHAIFQKTAWSQSDDQLASMKLDPPQDLNASCLSQADSESVGGLPLSVLTQLLKISCEQVVLFNQNNKSHLAAHQENSYCNPEHIFCLKKAINDLLGKQEPIQQLEGLLEKAQWQRDMMRNDRVLYLYRMLQTRQSSKVAQLPPLSTENFYQVVFGELFGYSERSTGPTNQRSSDDKESPAEEEKEKNSGERLSSNNKQSSKHFTSQGIPRCRHECCSQLFAKSNTSNSDQARYDGAKRKSTSKSPESSNQLKGLFTQKLNKGAAQTHNSLMLAEGKRQRAPEQMAFEGYPQGEAGDAGQDLLAKMGQGNSKDLLWKKYGAMTFKVGQIVPRPEEGYEFDHNENVKKACLYPNRGNQNEMRTRDSKLMDLINRLGDAASLNEQKMIAKTDRQNIRNRSLSEEKHADRYSMSEEANQQHEYQSKNYEEMRDSVGKRHKKTSEDNTLQKDQNLAMPNNNLPMDLLSKANAPASKPLERGHMLSEDDRSIKIVSGHSPEQLNSLGSADINRKDGSKDLQAIQIRMRQQKQPDKQLSNGNVCQICLVAFQLSSAQARSEVVQCEGPCKKQYHLSCAQRKHLIVKDLLKVQKSKFKGPQGRKPSSAGSQESQQRQIENGPEGQQSDENNQQAQPSNGKQQHQKLMCILCSKNMAQCYICKKTSPIISQNSTGPAVSSVSPTAKNQVTTENGVSNKDSKPELLEGKPSSSSISNDSSDEKVEKCIVGSCQKFYHHTCLRKNQNVDFYTNNKKQERFRCPLHYCSGCSISGNSVQILQCVACPTSYHLRCFRADRGAVKLTKKFILCGAHSNPGTPSPTQQKQRQKGDGSSALQQIKSSKNSKPIDKLHRALSKHLPSNSNGHAGFNNAPPKFGQVDASTKNGSFMAGTKVKFTNSRNR